VSLGGVNFAEIEFDGESFFFCGACFGENFTGSAGNEVLASKLNSVGNQSFVLNKNTSNAVNFNECRQKILAG